MSKTEYCALEHIGTHLDVDKVKLNKNFDIIDAQLKQAAEERNAESAARQALQGDLLGESQVRQSADEAETQARTQAIAAEVQARTAAVQEEATARAEAVAAEAKARAEAVAAEAKARTEALDDHDADAAAHAALIKRVTMGDMSPVIGVALVEQGHGPGLWCHVDAQGHVINPPRRYFDFHPIYSTLSDRVLVDGQVMQRYKAFYSKVETIADGELAGKVARYISPTPLEGFTLHPAFMKDKKPVPCFYLGTYEAHDDGGSPKKLGSKPGKAPFVNVNFSTMRQYCQNRNTGGVTGFDMWDIWEASAIQLLFLIEHATADSQGVLGRGRVDYGSVTAAALNNDPTVISANYHGLLGCYGNVWHMTFGLTIGTDGYVSIIKNDGSKEFVKTGHLMPAYNGSAPQYALTTAMQKTDDYDLGLCFIPATQVGSITAGTYPDYFYGRNGSAGNVLYLGGNWGGGSGAGLFAFSVNNPASDASVSVGCRLAKK